MRSAVGGLSERAMKASSALSTEGPGLGRRLAAQDLAFRLEPVGQGAPLPTAALLIERVGPFRDAISHLFGTILGNGGFSGASRRGALRCKGRSSPPAPCPLLACRCWSHASLLTPSRSSWSQAFSATATGSREAVSLRRCLTICEHDGIDPMSTIDATRLPRRRRDFLN